MIAFPAPLVARERQVKLVIGLTAEEAERELVAQGFRVRIAEGRESDPGLPANHVAWQDPPAYVELPAGSVVSLTLSAGAPSVAVPDVELFDFDEARRTIGAAGLAVGDIDSVPADADRGVVVSTRPAAGTPRPPGSAVALVVSRGPADVRVPSLIGLAEAVARQRLELAGFLVGTVEVRRGGRGRAGTVLEQSPAAGTMLGRGSRVDLTVMDQRQ
jgi:serine/threonine-protein kinase